MQKDKHRRHQEEVNSDQNDKLDKLQLKLTVVKSPTGRRKFAVESADKRKSNQYSRSSESRISERSQEIKTGKQSASETNKSKTLTGKRSTRRRVPIGKYSSPEWVCLTTISKDDTVEDDNFPLKRCQSYYENDHYLESDTDTEEELPRE